MAATRAHRRVPAVLRRHWTGLLVVVLSLTVAVAAVAAPGLKVADVRLQDGVIFAVNRSAGLLGTVNAQIRDLSGATSVAEENFSVLQEGRTVVVRNTSANQLQSYDPTTNELGSSISLPSGADVVLNGGKIAVVSRLNGAVWFGDAATMLQRDFNKEKAQLDLGENALVTVTSSGELIGLSLVDSQVVRLVNGQKTTSAVPMQLDSTVANVQLSAVGNKAVVLDRTKQLVWFEGADSPISMQNVSTAQLSAPIPATTLQGVALGAVLSTTTGVVGVTRKSLLSLSGAMSEGAVLPPVGANGCVYGVVGSKVSTSCPNGNPTTATIDGLQSNAELTLTVNGTNVILNDVVSGNIWLVTDGMRRITDWTKVTPSTKNKSKDTPDDSTVKKPADRSAQNRPPVAKDDTVTARPGRTTILPILDNDSDPDGDIITVVEVPTTGAGVTLQLVRGGTQLQAVIDEGATGQRTFQYRVTDGRGGTSDMAHVTLTIAAASQNQPPVLHDKDAVAVASGKVTQIRELTRWRDPEGDDMELVAVSAAGEDEVSFTRDGTITFTDVGKTTGIKTLNVTVSDGQATATDTLVLDVRKSADVTPVANGDFASAKVGQEIEVSPLDNDQGVNLALASVDNPVPMSSKFVVDYSANTFRFRASNPGTYYVSYTVTNGRTAVGLVRIDVTEAATTNSPPITTRDVVMLTHGGSVTLDPLANDEDPDGDVLVVQTYTSGGLNVTMRDRHIMTISEIAAADTPVTLTYWVSDGYHPAVPGTIVVMRSNPVGQVRPVAVADDVNVRVGDAVTVDPLVNDYSPLGLELSLDTKLYDNLGGAWVDGNKIRFVAPATPGRVTATYQVKDSVGRTASAVVKFNVISPDIVNQPPVAELVTGRVLAGTTQRITIPLEGIDPNGDTVRLVGLGSGPKLGRIMAVGATYLEYQAFAKSSGTDSFTYTVVDTQGATATGEIRVGVVAASVTNTAPVANQDVVVTRPGRTVYIQPLANDSDADGDKISLVAENAVSFTIPAQVVDTSAIQVTVPDEAGTWFGTYKITDARGALATGNIVVTADPSAPLLAPKAFDDLVDASEVFQRDTVDVPVLANDFDPDGLRSDLVLSVPAYDTGGAPAAQVVTTSDGPQLRVPIGDKMRVIRYTITDADGLTASAFVTVPGKGDATPYLKDPTVELQVTAGEVLTIPVSQYVAGTQGRNVVVSSADKVTGAPGNGQRYSATELTYQAGDTESGPAAITFEVVEDVDASVTDARSATLTIRITVTPRATKKPGDPGYNGSTNTLNQPPYAPGGIEIKTGKGEAATEQNLAAFLVDPDGDAITVGSFEPQLPSGVSVTMQGSTIFATATFDAKVGSSGVVKVKVSDDKGAESVVSVSVVVVQTTRPLTVTVEDDADANQGQASPVLVTANDKSSLDNATLKVVSAVVEQGTGTAQVSNDSTVTVTPDKDFRGTMVVRYTVADATGDTDRYVDGRIVLNVRGKPLAPGIPRLESLGDQQLTVTFSAPDNGGLPITKYWLTATGANGHTVKQQCDTTTCTIKGLDNAVEFTLKASAENEIGEGPLSAESAVMVPDVVPDKITSMTVQRKAGDEGGVLVISWTPPANRGSAITSYAVTMLSGETRTLDSSKTSLEWAGLTNGTPYSFTVQATNNSGTSDPSDSVTGHPSAPPSEVKDLVAYDNGALDGGALTVTWSAPQDIANGQPIDTFIVKYGTSSSFDDMGNPRTIDANSQDNTYSTTIYGLTNGTTYYVGVQAISTSGDGKKAVSAAAMPFTATASTPTVTPGDEKITVVMPASTQSGVNIVGWTVVAHPTSGPNITRSPSPQAGGAFTLEIDTGANQYGKTWNLTVTPTVQSGQTTKPGKPWTGGPYQPAGDMAAPQVVAADYSNAVVDANGLTSTVKVKFAVTKGSTNGHPDVTSTYKVGGTTQAVSGGTEFSVDVPVGSDTTIIVTQTSSDGATSATTVTVPRPITTSGTNVVVKLLVNEPSLACSYTIGGGAAQGAQTVQPVQSGSTYSYTYDLSALAVGTKPTVTCTTSGNTPVSYITQMTRS